MEEVSLCGLEHFIQYLDYKKRLRPTCVSTSHTHTLSFTSLLHTRVYLHMQSNKSKSCETLFYLGLTPSVPSCCLWRLLQLFRICPTASDTRFKLECKYRLAPASVTPRLWLFVTAFKGSWWFDLSGRSESSDLRLTPEMVEAEFCLSERSSATSIKEDGDEDNGSVQWVIKSLRVANYLCLSWSCWG